MAIRVGPLSTQLWSGLSGDTKPTASDARIRQNDVFFETDTFKWYLWNGDVWCPTTNGAVASGSGGTPPPMA
jgi:hypothetical protein